MYGATAKAFPATLTSGSTLLAAGVDISSTWSRVMLEIPSHASCGTIYVRASDSLTGTYYRIHGTDPADGGENVCQFLSPNGAMVEIPSVFQFYKVECTSGITDVHTTFKFHCA